MDVGTNHEESASFPPSLHSGGPDSDVHKSSVSVKTSRDSESTGEVMTIFGLDVACISEKLMNLNLLLMHVEAKERDLQASSPETDDLVFKKVEYDLLSVFLDSEIGIIETHISDLQIKDVREFVSSRKHTGESVAGIEERLHDSEKSLEQSLEQVVELKTRSANVEKNLLRFSGEKDSTEALTSTDLLELEKMKMKTVEHQRHVLRMLEKSLEREKDLEKRASDVTQTVETLTMRIRVLEQEVEEAEMTLEKFYETDHASELLMQTAKELITKLQMLQFNLKGSIQRESELNNDLLKLKERDTNAVLLEKELGDARVKLQHAEACCEASEEEKSMFQSTINDMGNVIDDLKKKVAQAEIQTGSVEDRCIALSELNSDLKKELKSIKGKVKSLEKSLHQMEEAKKAFGKDINRCTKFTTELASQMKLERERLQKQISSLKQENKMLANCLKKANKDPAVKVSHGDNSTTENKEAVSTTSEVEKVRKETVTDSTETARDIDARQIKTRDILLVLIILIIPLIGILVYQS